MSAKRLKDEGWISWGLIVLLFLFGLALALVLLIFLKLFGVAAARRSGRRRLAPAGDRRAGQRGGVAAQPAQPGPEDRPSGDEGRASQKKSTARTLMIVDAILAAVGLVACAEPVEMMLWLKEITSYYMEDLLSALAMLVAAAP